jgi:Galactose oxidase, central domain
MFAGACAANSPAQVCSQWVDISPSPLPPESGAMVYDTLRDRVILFGGLVGNGSFTSDLWEWDGASWAWRTASGPEARANHAMVYDSVRNVSVLFGGYCTFDVLPNCQPFSDTWVWDGTSWTEVIGTSPPARSNHAMAFDESRGVVVLFGGRDANDVPLGDLWEWDGANWTERAVTGPSARFNQAMSFDASRGVSVLYGGNDGSTSLADLWEWDGTAWTQRTESGPSTRSTHVLVYDSVSERTILYGGDISTDTWSWDGVSWAQLNVAGPEQTFFAAAAFDKTLNLVVMFGGFGASFQTTDSIARWDGISWSELPPPAMPRFSGPIVYDDGRGVLVALATGLGLVYETWEYGGTVWIRRAGSDSVPHPTATSSMTYDQQRGKTVAWVGGDTGETWEWDGSIWVMSASIAPPGPRTGSQLVYDSVRNVVLLHGGQRECYPTPEISPTAGQCDMWGDTWTWDGNQWTIIANGGPERAGYSIAFDSIRGVALLYGGTATGPTGFCPTESYETWTWNGTQWALLATDGPVG